MNRITGVLEAAPLCYATTKPRERILLTARELFRRFGIRAIGVDTIAEAAGTNKMTLYRHFGSKADLVCACLRIVAEESLAEWDALAERYPDDPKAQLAQWLRLGAERVASDDRGCDLANAAVELTEPDHPARKLIEEVKRHFRERLTALCGAAGAMQPDLLADTLCLMFEGARVSRLSVGAEGPSARFLRTSEAVVAAFGGPGELCGGPARLENATQSAGPRPN